MNILLRDKAGRARTCSLVRHLEDVFKHRWDASSPFFVKFDKKSKKKKSAGDDDEEGKSPELDERVKELICDEWMNLG